MAKKRKTLPKEIDEVLKTGDVKELKKLFSRCEPNALRYSKYSSNIFSLSPLPREFAVWAKEQGADVNFVDYYGNRPIFNQICAREGDVQLLIDLGADIHYTQYDGCTPLHNAASYGRVKAVKALLAAGAEVNAPAGSFLTYRTPLEMALSKHRGTFDDLLELCTVLLEYGAQITDLAREAVREAGEDFERTKRGIQDPEFLAEETESLNRLYELFHVEPAEEVPFHDGVSPIVIEEEGFAAQYNKLWDYLIPPRGRARTAQGEALRIAGRVEDELLRNGGMN